MGIKGGGIGRVGRGSLIAVVVALVLFAVPLLVVGAASGRTNAGRASSSRGGRVSHVAFLAPVAGFIVNELASNLFSTGFGWVLGQFGDGDGLDGKMAPILEKLRVIEDQLSAIEASTGQLRGELAQGTYSGLVAQTTPIIGHINAAMDELEFISRMPADDPSKKLLTGETLRFIHDHLLYKQQELAERISGTAGADGLITAAYKVASTPLPTFWTRSDSNSVWNVLAYYQDAEARLLLLRVEYWHAHPNTYSPSYVGEKVEAVKQMLSAQLGLRKGRPIFNTFADTRTFRDWSTNDLFVPATRAEADRLPGIYQGRLPNEAEVEHLIKGWHGKNWADWLNSKLGGQLTVPCCFQGVWTGTYLSGGSLGTGQVAVMANGQITVPPPGTRLGVMFLRSRTAGLPYW